MIIAEAISFGPEILLIAAVVLLVAVAATVAYVVVGYRAVWQVAAGSRSPWAVTGTVLAVLIGAYLLLVPVLDGQPPLLTWIPPAIHGVAAWRGRRHAERMRSAPR